MRATVLLALALAGCTDDTPAPRRADALDCVWVESEDNCWRAAVLAVEVCLGAPTSPKGELAADLRSCTYSDGRTITGTEPLFVTDPKTINRRDFEAKGPGGASCVRFTEQIVRAGDGGTTGDVTSRDVTIVAPTGTLRWNVANGRSRLTCPDGKTFDGDATDIRDCLSPSRPIPGYAWSSDGTPATGMRASFQLLGMAAPIYACELPPPK
ncbi:MAG: hypothetical protein HYV09_13640 [Deltaproteobacteria bacterium]|nr:hypothetical protein [Deltaproteobacteria bacterium]